jgi:hypothetical protein
MDLEDRARLRRLLRENSPTRADSPGAAVPAETKT